MQFRTELSIPPSSNQFSHQDSFLTIGSCFAEVMGTRLEQVKAKTLINPFGTIFNPLSANKLIRAAIIGDFEFLDEGLVEHQGLWHHYDFHSSFNAPEPDLLLQQLKQILIEVKTFLDNTQVLLLTWGTAYIYERAATGTLVANCHKVPQKKFNKRLLDLAEITLDTQQTLDLLEKHHPQLQIILTISPVRHIKDTIQLNSVSKSLLRIAAHQIVEQNPMVSYFPAFELLLDDLRDYRFYGDDLIHPSPMAEEYIWQKFITTYANENFHEFLKQWLEIKRDLAHRAFQPESPAHQKFLQALLTKLNKIADQVDVQSEIATVKRQLRT